MQNNTSRIPYAMSVLLLLLMLAQSVLGLVFPDGYRDSGYVRDTWFGNDLITLVLAVPLLMLALVLEKRASIPGRLLWLGSLGYAIYNYAFYMLGAALNPFFLFYLAAFVISVIAVIMVLARTDITSISSAFNKRTPVKIIGVFYAFTAFALAGIWISMWALYVFAGKALPSEPAVFQVVAVLDLTIMVPALLAGGLLLFMKKQWGYIISAMAGIQASLYLIILALNSVIFVINGSVEAPGELPVWVPLSFSTILFTILLLRGLSRKSEQ